MSEEVITEIINAITVYGADATDGECLDQVWAILERAGYGEQLKQSSEKYLKEILLNNE
jgi:hypothetical protein